MHLYNTLTRKVEEFKPIRDKEVAVYSCGPTVYWFAHIGNMRAYLFADVLRRAFEFAGYRVKQVVNITDVGHLVGDADEGEDKMIVAMRREGKTAYDIAEFYAQAFFRDLGRLNILPVSEYPRATAHIPEQIAMIQRLETNGFTYQTSDGIYFDTSKLPEYGKLSGQKSEEKKAGARVEMGEKRNATDFALWKFSPSTTDSTPRREMEWDSPWGVGFPGWHIECSAMSQKYLGVPFDIHTGGIDHIPVHHENEIAQTLGADGVPEANVWMHSEFITVDGGKMSKSLGNVYTIEDLIDRGYDPIAYRYFVLGAHYRSKLNFTWEALDAAQNALKRLRETVREWNRSSELDLLDQSDLSSGFLSSFSAELENDLNTPKALSVLWGLVEDQTISSTTKSSIALSMDRVLGLGLDAYVGKQEEIPDEILALAKQRDAARAAKDWGESDRLRDAIADRGFSVEDTASGMKIRPF
jgi:cysteinyl-tRNA synthetase